MLKECLHAYLMQRLSPDGMPLDAGKLLHLATLAGAQALGLDDEIGDFTPGKAADIVHMKPAPGGVLAAVIERAGSSEQALTALFTMARADAICEVRVAGDVVYRAEREAGQQRA
jgi:guanine deaminase